MDLIGRLTAKCVQTSDVIDYVTSTYMITHFFPSIIREYNRTNEYYYIRMLCVWMGRLITKRVCYGEVTRICR